MRRLASFVLLPFLLGMAAQSQQTQRTRLILRDGSFQTVLDYKVEGENVFFHSAERNGEEEEIPLKLVDLAATERWKSEHAPGQQPSVVLSPELAKAEADRAAHTPEVAPNLHLVKELSVLALDDFKGEEELVPLRQQGGGLDPETAHDVLKTAINPASSPHRLTEIAGESAAVQLHQLQPVFFMQVGQQSGEPDTGSGLVVDTHGANARVGAAPGDRTSAYVLERLDVRQGQRRVLTLRIEDLDTGKPQRDVIRLKHETLPGGYWLRLTPEGSLLPGEYALVEILDDSSLNALVWDFGIHPAAPESAEAIHPEIHKAPALGHR
ncbi:MAG: hypothetical protein PW735_08770 [Acidobacteriaceae bacterium]|nr:hypothetical protein [Acidobacteriaceae bacterium]